MQRTYFTYCTDTIEGGGQLSGRGRGCLLALHQPGCPRMVAVQTQFFARTSSYQLARIGWLSFLRILIRLPHYWFGTLVASSPWDDQRPFLGCNCTLSPRVTWVRPWTNHLITVSSRPGSIMEYKVMRKEVLPKYLWGMALDWTTFALACFISDYIRIVNLYLDWDKSQIKWLRSIQYKYVTSVMKLVMFSTIITRFRGCPIFALGYSSA